MKTGGQGERAFGRESRRALGQPMATQVQDEDDEDEVSSQTQQRVAEFSTLAPGQDPDITPLSLPGDGPWEFSAGRDAARDIVIDSGSVSGHHADICAPATPCPAPEP